MKKLIILALFELSLVSCKKENMEMYYMSQIAVTNFNGLTVDYTVMYKNVRLEGKSLVFEGNTCIQNAVAFYNNAFKNQVKSFEIISKQEQICQQ